MFDHSNKSYKDLLSYTFLNVWVRVWNPKCLTIQMKATRAYFPILFQTFGSVYEILSVWPFKWKIQRPSFLYFFKRLGPCMKSKVFDHSNESYKGLLSNTLSNFWLRVWKPKCLTIQMKATKAYFPILFQTSVSAQWNAKCVTIQSYKAVFSWGSVSNVCFYG